MAPFRIVFLLTLAAGLALRTWLAIRQEAHVAAHRSTVPEAFRGRMPPQVHDRATRYTIARNRLAMASDVIGAGVLLVWTLGGGLEALAGFWDGTGWPGLARGVALLLSVIALQSVPGVALSAINAFGIEERFGFNRTRPLLFAIDMAKGAALLLALGLPVATAALWLMENGGSFWWLYAWAGGMALSAGLAWAYPALIAPRFNTFTPLSDDVLSRQVEGLLARCGFRSSGIFVMDGSRRSAHGNAYFTGFGRTRRIVLFDTLLAELRPPEILAILAHELGHYRRGHIPRQIAIQGAATFAVLGLFSWLNNQSWLFSGLGVGLPQDATALALLVLAGPAFAFFLTPAFAAISRHFEIQADDFATEHVDPDHLVEALTKLYAQNATTLAPDPLHSAFYDSHPPAPVRIARLERSRGRQAAV